MSNFTNFIKAAKKYGLKYKPKECQGIFFELEKDSDIYMEYNPSSEDLSKGTFYISSLAGFHLLPYLGKIIKKGEYTQSKLNIVQLEDENVVKNVIHDLNRENPAALFAIFRDFIEGYTKDVESKTAAEYEKESKLMPLIFLLLTKDSDNQKIYFHRDFQYYKDDRIDIDSDNWKILNDINIKLPETLEELNEVKSPALVSLAVKIGKTRLIDNVVLE